MTQTSVLPGMSVVVPVYQCAGSIEPLYDRLRSTMDKLELDFELIFVDDASSDKAWERIGFLSQRDDRIKAIQLSENGGQMAAIMSGLTIARGDWTLVMDCDLQDSPELIPAFIKAAKPPIELVFARYVSRHDPYWRRFASRLYYKLLGVATEDKGTLGTFSLLSRRARQAYLDSPLSGKAYLILLLRLGLKKATIPCNKNQRIIGKSSYTLWKLVKVTLRVMFLFRPVVIMLSISCLIIMTIVSLAVLEILGSAKAWLLAFAVIFMLSIGQLMIHNKLKARRPVCVTKSVNLMENQRKFLFNDFQFH